MQAQIPNGFFAIDVLTGGLLISQASEISRVALK
jgi:hypothetical protein